MPRRVHESGGLAADVVQELDVLLHEPLPQQVLVASAASTRGPLLRGPDAGRPAPLESYSKGRAACCGQEVDKECPGSACSPNADLDTLATARCARSDDLLKRHAERVLCRPEVGIAPQIASAEIITLAVMQALLGHNSSEGRWLRHATRPGQILIGDKNHDGRGFEADLVGQGIDLLRGSRKGEAERPRRQVLQASAADRRVDLRHSKASSIWNNTAAAPCRGIRSRRPTPRGPSVARHDLPRMHKAAQGRRDAAERC